MMVMPAKGWRSQAKAARDGEIVEMCRQGFEYLLIARRFGLSPSTISQIARANGLPCRTTADRAVSDETRRRLSIAMTGLARSESHCINISKAKRAGQNGAWRGTDVGYSGAHKWLRKEYGTPKHCENCNGVNAKSGFYDWANLAGGGRHTRHREDYIRLCRSCHIRHDRYGMLVAFNYPLSAHAGPSH